MPSFEVEDSCVELNRPQPLLGSAPSNVSLVVIECPKPWAPKVHQSSGFPEWATLLLAQAQEKGVEFSTLSRVPVDPEKLSGVLYRRWNGKTYQRPLVGGEDLAALLTAEGLHESWSAAAPALYICTHGSRDTCCGRLGVPVLQAARAIGGRDIFDASHLGGHRFAPTLLSLPEWRYYGRLDEDQVPAFLASLDAADVSRLPWLRGAAFVAPEVQVVEAEIARQRGKFPDDARLLDSQRVANTQRVRVALTYGEEVLEVEGTLNVEQYRGPVSCSDVDIGLAKSSESFRIHKELRIGEPAPEIA